MMESNRFDHDQIIIICFIIQLEFIFTIGIYLEDTRIMIIYLII